jgi:hypothetical protein
VLHTAVTYFIWLRLGFMLPDLREKQHVIVMEMFSMSVAYVEEITLLVQTVLECLMEILM